ncbi:NYNRI protein, partial [Polyodon spathula]|nr:NYNRI protein [Polyodon spathula]
MLYVVECPECQQVVLGRVRPAPLVPLPLISVPFECIAMGIVGSLSQSESGYTYILVVVDYATRYPEAVPLRSTSAAAIARELVHIIERMLKRFVNQEQKHWAKLLPYLMFAVREVSQNSTGFSPFELLYGRQPRGIVDLVKEGWEEQTKTSKNIVKYVIMLRDYLELVGHLAQENFKLAQHCQEQQYNKQVRIQTFWPGDKVLLLLPTSESKSYAKWQGPYEVIQGIGNVNYEIRQPDRQNKTQIYHINLLKPWNEREALLIAGNSYEEDSGPLSIHQLQLIFRWGNSYFQIRNASSTS